MITAEQLRALQTPLKKQYKDDPSAARVTLRARGALGEDITCAVETSPAPAGLHPKTGGDGTKACSGDMLLQALVACSGVTLAAVSTALAIPIARATITAEGDIDFRGTLGVAKDAPVGFEEIRLRFDIETSAGDEQIAKLLELTERYCVVYQTLRTPPKLSARRA